MSSSQLRDRSIITSDRLWLWIARRAPAIRGVVGTLVGVALAILVANQISGARITAQFNAEVRACRRLNVVRASDNRNQLADYKFDMLEVALVRASLRRTTASVHRTAAQRQATIQFIAGLSSAASAKEWIPLTPCVKAVQYELPLLPPVAFRRHLPPQSALRRSSAN